MMKENRLIGYSLEEINAQRKANGATAVSSPMNSRAADANAMLQDQQHQAAVLNNQTTGTLGTYNAASERAAQLKDPTNAAASFLNEQSNTYANKNAGLNTSLDTKTGVTQVAGNGGIEQSAIDRLRKSGMNDEQIRTQLAAEKPQIESTMSNTGLGGSFDKNGIYVAPGGRDSVINDRKNQIDNIKTVMKTVQTGTDKSGNPVFSQIPDEAATQAAKDAKQSSFDAQDAYDQNNQKRADADMAARDAARHAQELNTKTAADKAASIKAAADSKVKSTIKSTALDQYLATLSPEDQKLMEPYRILQNSQNEILDSLSQTALDTKNSGESLADKIAAGETSLLDEYKKTADEDKASAEEFLKQQKEDAEANLLQQKKDAQAELDWNTQSEIRTSEANKTKTLEDMAASAALSGSAFSTNATQSMSKAEQSANQAIEDLKAQSGFKRADINNSFTTAYSGVQQTYTKGLYDALKDYRSEKSRILGLRFTSEENKAKEYQRVDENYSKVLSDVATAKANNLAGIVTNIQAAVMQEKTMAHQDKTADDRMKWQAKQNELSAERASARAETAAEKADARAAARQDAADAKNQKTYEKQSADDVRAGYKNVIARPDVQNYLTLKTSLTNMDTVLQGAAGSKDPNVIGAAKQLALTLVAKASDPSTGVREGELTKFGKSQTWVQNVMQANKGIFGGDMTGVSLEAVNAYKEMLNLEVAAENASASVAMSTVLNSIITHNNRAQYYPLNPVDILPPEFLNDAADAFDSYNRSESRMGQGYSKLKWSSDGGDGGGETSFGDELSSLGRFTQEFDTPIASVANGGLYDESTVKAWGGKHAGVDIALPQGSDFQSLVDGEIVEVGDEKGWGGTIVIRDAAGGEHRMSHLSEINPNLKKGEMITQGTLIAKTGGAKGEHGSGNSTGAHVDYRIKVNGKYVNPATYNPYA